jgi:hypothetical protein
LPTAVAQNQARIQGADLVGQPLGGALFGISRCCRSPPTRSRTPSRSYRCSSSAEVPGRAPRSVTRLRAEMLEGVRWLWHQPFLRARRAARRRLELRVQRADPRADRAGEEPGASSATVGIMLAFLGGGAIVGSLVAPWVQRRVHAKVIMIGSFWVWAVGAFVSAFVESPIALGAIWAVGGIFGPIFNVAFSTYRYALVPDRLLARVGSAALVVAWGRSRSDSSRRASCSSASAVRRRSSCRAASRPQSASPQPSRDDSHGAARERAAQLRVTSATACAARPSPRPVKPSLSVVVAPYADRRADDLPSDAPSSSRRRRCAAPRRSGRSRR